jgi:hypothetical protein
MVGLTILNEDNVRDTAINDDNVRDKPIRISFRQKDQLPENVIWNDYTCMTLKLPDTLVKQLALLLHIKASWIQILVCRLGSLT